jgi:hypothetical protein
MEDLSYLTTEYARNKMIESYNMEEKMENEVIEIKNQSIQATPATLLNIAIEKGADLEKLEKLMDLQIKWEENQAKKAYFAAMASFKANPPEIEKDKNVDYTTKAGNKVKYDHASLGNVTQKISAALGEHGLSAAWKTQQDDKKITVTCRISHSLGYGEETSLSSSPDDSGGKNPIQSLGSTITYLERYTLLALTGLATQDQDDDGNGAVAYISDKQKSTIIDMINDKQADEAKFCEYMKVDKISEIKESDFNKAMSALRAKKEKK